MAREAEIDELRSRFIERVLCQVVTTGTVLWTFLWSPNEVNLYALARVLDAHPAYADLGDEARRIANELTRDVDQGLLEAIDKELDDLQALRDRRGETDA